MQSSSIFALAVISAGSLISAAAIPGDIAERAAVCYATCNNALIELNTVGTGAACTLGSQFGYDVAACIDCEDANGGNAYVDWPQIMDAC